MPNLYSRGNMVTRLKTNHNTLFLFKDPNYAANRRTSLNENADPKSNTKNKKDNVSTKYRME